jgi:hypothetical protein
MLDEVKRKLRSLMKKPRRDRHHHDARIPEGAQPGGPERPDEAHEVAPPREETGAGSAEADQGAKELRHDGWTGIRPRKPGEDTDMGRDIVPDITMPGRDLLPPDDDRGTEGAGGSSGSK